MQAVGRKMVKIKLESVEIAEIVFSILLLPWYKFQEAIDFLKEKQNNATGTENTKLTELVRYISKTWLLNAKIVSVYGSEARTNNCIESGNGYLKKSAVHIQICGISLVRIYSTVLLDNIASFKHLKTMQ